jgi:hypothetical protein
VTTPGAPDYTAHSPVTDPGPGRAALVGLAEDAAGLRALVPGLVIHAAMGPLYGADLRGREPEARLRTFAAMLERLLALDARPLSDARPPERRLVGNCRASTVTACSLLREAGFAARARCGFSGYFTSPIRGDHWVVECWDDAEARWRLVDAELDDPLMADNGIEFDPMDVPRDRFVQAGEAWLACRSGEDDPASFGLDPQTTGLDYVRGQLVRDLAALARLEVGPWDTWGLGAPDLQPVLAELEVLDAAARASAAGDGSEAMTLLLSTSELLPPGEYLRDA